MYNSLCLFLPNFSGIFIVEYNMLILILGMYRIIKMEVYNEV